MERRQEPLHRYVDELHERRDDEDERKGVYVPEAVGLQKPVVYAPRHRRRHRHHEDDRAGHPKRRLELLRDAKERTTPKKAAENEVVHQDRAY